MKVRQNAPLSVGSSFMAACSILESAAACASSAVITSESEVAVIGARRPPETGGVPISPSSRARALNSAVLTRFPLWPNASPEPTAVVRKIGCAFSQVVEPVVE